MATNTVRGKAQVSGCAAMFDVILYPVQQSMRLSHKFKEEIIMDALGQDTSWRAYNEMIDGNWEMKILGDTSAHAQAGAAFFAPLAIVTVSGSPVVALNTTWQIAPDSDIVLKNDAVGDINFRVRRYVDSVQNTLAQTTPS